MLFLILIYQDNFDWKKLDEWAHKATEYYVYFIGFQNILRGRDEEMLRGKTEIESFGLKEKAQKQAEKSYWLRG